MTPGRWKSRGSLVRWWIPGTVGDLRYNIQDLGFTGVQLQRVRLHPSGNDLDALRDTGCTAEHHVAERNQIIILLTFCPPTIEKSAV